MKPRELAGTRFGRLTVVSRESTLRYGSKWLCLCDCGNETVVHAGNLLRGRTRSCGCYHAERLRSDNVTHGMAGSRIHRIWSGMLNRCENPNNQAYRLYGARGIGVCSEWHSFECFYADMKDGYQDDLTLDRINNDGDYEPGNCRWADWKTQQRNRRSNRIVVVNGAEACVSEHAEKYGTDWPVVQRRLRAGWPIDAAVTVPLDGSR